ncbi:MAG: sulfatase-like hydrolase/transferase [Candidatus Latescibacterota bacterium]|nr:sulfatase-like hydrolase/transferase [Candidatus Latescibacterota bacterium]
MDAKNFLFILSDQHHRRFSGAYGHPCVETPNLDALAAKGTRFENAYTNCPICVPSRASLATGRYVHDINFWDNGHPYDGSIPSWHSRLRDQQVLCESIGKLHFKGLGRDHGFHNEIEPLHVVDGVGDTLGCIRDDPPPRDKVEELENAGGGDSTYLRYDARCCTHARNWIKAHRKDEKPWALFLNFVCPHPPYIGPRELYNKYKHEDFLMPPQWEPTNWPAHPAIEEFRRFFSFTNGHTEESVRRVSAAYMAAVSYLDCQIGKVITELQKYNLTEETRIIYSSDHGECLGARGLFGKFTLYDEAAAVPLIMAGPDVPSNKVVQTPVSLVDIFPTALDCVGAKFVDNDLPGDSLLKIANSSNIERTVLSEYHALGSINGSFMLRRSRYKFIYYVNSPAQLFDLEEDPLELHDLSTDKKHSPLMLDFEKRLRIILNPEEVNQKAHEDQKALIHACGGEDAIRLKGAFDHSPTPGEKPSYRIH